MVFETNGLKGVYFQEVETECFHHGGQTAPPYLAVVMLLEFVSSARALRGGVGSSKDARISRIEIHLQETVLVSRCQQEIYQIILQSLVIVTAVHTV